MARTHYVKRARKSKKKRVCATCGNEIQLGESYKWMEKRVGYPYYGSHFLYWCHEHSPTRKQTVTSAFQRAIMDIEDMVDDLGDEFTMEDAIERRDSIADAVQDLAEEEREKAQNIEAGFGWPTSVSEDFEYRAQDLEAAAEGIRGLDFPNEPDEELGDEPDAPGWHGTDEATDEEQEEYESEREAWDTLHGEWEEWREEVRSALEEAVSEVNV